MVKGSVELDLVNVGDFFSSHCLGKQLHIVGLITFCALKHPFVAILTTFLFFSSDMYTVPLPVFLCCHFCNPALLSSKTPHLTKSVAITLEISKSTPADWCMPFRGFLLNAGS